MLIHGCISRIIQGLTQNINQLTDADCYVSEFFFMNTDATSIFTHTLTSLFCALTTLVVKEIIYGLGYVSVDF